MGENKFTEEQQNQLRNNPYIEKVSETTSGIRSARSRKILLTDITYLKYGNGRRAYLSTLVRNYRTAP